MRRPSGGGGEHSIPPQVRARVRQFASLFFSLRGSSSSEKLCRRIRFLSNQIFNPLIAFGRPSVSDKTPSDGVVCRYGFFFLPRTRLPIPFESVTFRTSYRACRVVHVHTVVGVLVHTRGVPDLSTHATRTRFRIFLFFFVFLVFSDRDFHRFYTSLYKRVRRGSDRPALREITPKVMQKPPLKGGV